MTIVSQTRIGDKEKPMEEKKRNEGLWIIKYSDGQLRSFTGTKDEAEKAAEEEAAGRRWVVV